MPLRVQIAVRFDVEDLDAIRVHAARETEGNVSQMVRRLVSEALQARDREAGSMKQPPT